MDFSLLINDLLYLLTINDETPDIKRMAVLKKHQYCISVVHQTQYISLSLKCHRL